MLCSFIIEYVFANGMNVDDITHLEKDLCDYKVELKSFCSFYGDGKVVFKSQCLTGCGSSEFECGELLCLRDLLYCTKECDGTFLLFDHLLTSNFSAEFDIVECKYEKICCLVQAYLEDVLHLLKKHVFDEKILIYILKRFEYWLSKHGHVKYLIYLPCYERRLIIDAHLVWECFLAALKENFSLKRMFIRFLRMLCRQVKQCCPVIKCKEKEHYSYSNVKLGFNDYSDNEQQSCSCDICSIPHKQKHKTRHVRISEYAALVFCEYIDKLIDYIENCLYGYGNQKMNQNILVMMKDAHNGEVFGCTMLHHAKSTIDPSDNQNFNLLQNGQPNKNSKAQNGNSKDNPEIAYLDEEEKENPQEKSPQTTNSQNKNNGNNSNIIPKKPENKEEIPATPQNGKNENQNKPDLIPEKPQEKQNDKTSTSDPKENENDMASQLELNETEDNDVPVGGENKEEK